MLLTGNRKFDIRVWVLVDASFRVYVHREGVLRTTSVPFTTEPESLQDDFVHLSNHCIQIHSDAYGAYEATNEMFFSEFDAYLSAHYSVSPTRKKDGASSVGVVPAIVQRNITTAAVAENNMGHNATELRPASLEHDVLPQIHRIVAMTLHAGRTRMESAKGQSYGCFHLFGYDFMVDEHLRVQLLEINSSPAVAESLFEEITKDVVNVAIRSFYDDDKGGGGNESTNKKEECLGGFQEVSCAKWCQLVEKKGQ